MFSLGYSVAIKETLYISISWCLFRMLLYLTTLRTNADPNILLVVGIDSYAYRKRGVQ